MADDFLCLSRSMSKMASSGKASPVALPACKSLNGTAEPQERPTRPNRGRLRDPCYHIEMLAFQSGVTLLFSGMT